MKLEARGFAALGVAVTLLGSVTAADAASSTASVLVTSFSYTTSGGTLNWSDPYQSFAATALNAGGLLGASTDAFETEDFGLAIAGASTSRANAAVSTTMPQTFWASAETVTSTGAVTN